MGGTIGFVLVALVWFYLVSLSMMAGAVINALRYELRDTGEIAVAPLALTEPPGYPGGALPPSVPQRRHLPPAIRSVRLLPL